MVSKSSITFSLSLEFAGGAVSRVLLSSLFLTNIFTPKKVSERLYLLGLGEGHLPDHLLKQLKRLVSQRPGRPRTAGELFFASSSGSHQPRKLFVNT